LASQINASNSGFGGIVSTGDSSGVLQLQAAGTTIATIQSTGLNLSSNGLVFSDSSTQTAAASPYVLKNRIINGDMRIDQRNAGAAVTINSNAYTYVVDRWSGFGSATDGVFTLQRSTTAPTGFTNSLLATVTTADASIGASQYYVIEQFIEGFNVADLDFGTANAKTITISFWVRSSVTGTFSGSIANTDYTRSYPFTYTISSANTFEYKTVTIAGDTTGTWNKDNGIGMRLYFDLGSGSSTKATAGAWTGSGTVGATGSTNLIATNGATWYITGVQLEIGTSATPFERRLYNQELANCQRYYYKLIGTASETFIGSGYNNSTTNALIYIPFLVQMRTTPSSLETTGTANNYALRVAGGQTNCSSIPVISGQTQNGSAALFTVSSGLSSLGGTLGIFTVSSAFLGWSAEL
jgi:hypothetical protein